MESRGRSVLLVILLVLMLATTWLIARPYRMDVVTETRTETIAFEKQRVASPELPVGTEVIVQAGKLGRKTTYVYFRERSFLGKVSSRIEVPAGDRPTERIEVAAAPEIVEYGTADEFTVDLNASAESGVDIGVIGPKGALLVKASGTIRYWKGGTCGPEGDATHDYTFTPIRPDVNVGALMLRVGSAGPYVPYVQLTLTNGMRTVTGTPGEHVRAVVNDAAGLYSDNTGVLRISVIVR